MRIPEVLRQIPNKPDTPPSPAPVGYGELIVGIDRGTFYSPGTPVAVVSVGVGDAGSHGALWETAANGLRSFGSFLEELEAGGSDRTHFPKVHELIVQRDYPRIDAQTLQTNEGFRPYVIILPVADPQRPVPYGPMKVKDICAYQIVSALLGPHDIVEDFVARRSTVNSGKTSLETSIDITYNRILEPGRVYSVLYEPQQRALAPEQIGRLSIMEPFGGAGSVMSIPDYTPRAKAKKPTRTVVLPRLGDLWGGVKDATQRLGSALAYLLESRPVPQQPTTNPPQAPGPATGEDIWHVPPGIEQNFQPSRSTARGTAQVHVQAEETNPLENLLNELTSTPCGGCRGVLPSEPRDPLVVGIDQRIYHTPCFDEFVGSTEKTQLGISYQEAYVTLDLLKTGNVKFTSRAEILTALQVLPETLRRYNLRGDFDRRISQLQSGTKRFAPRDTLRLTLPNKDSEQQGQ